MSAPEEPAQLDTLTPPDRGVAVLGCRCGRVLDAADMRWAPPPPPDVFRPIPSIVCGVCRNLP